MECSETVTRLQAEHALDGKIFFKGSSGDAQAFKQRHEIDLPVTASDEAFHAEKIDACPAIVVKGGSTARYGNGKPVSDKDCKEVANLVRQ